MNEAERIGRIILDLPGAWPKDSAEAATVKVQAIAAKAEEDRKRLIFQVRILAKRLLWECDAGRILGDTEKQVAKIRETIHELNRRL